MAGFLAAAGTWIDGGDSWPVRHLPRRARDQSGLTPPQPDQFVDPSALLLCHSQNLRPGRYPVAAPHYDACAGSLVFATIITPVDDGFPVWHSQDAPPSRLVQRRQGYVNDSVFQSQEAISLTPISQNADRIIRLPRQARAPQGDVVGTALFIDQPVWFAAFQPPTVVRNRLPVRPVDTPPDVSPMLAFVQTATQGGYQGWDIQGPGPVHYPKRAAIGAVSQVIADDSLLTGAGIFPIPQNSGPVIRFPWHTTAAQLSASQQSEAWQIGSQLIIVAGPYWAAAGSIYCAGAVAGYVRGV